MYDLFTTDIGDFFPKRTTVLTSGLAAGLGLNTFRDLDGPTWFKGGHDDIPGNMVICQEHRKRCVVMLANDVRAERFPELARLVLGPTNMPWLWNYGPPAVTRNAQP